MKTNIEHRLQELLEAAISIDGADMGNIQVLRPAQEDLIIIAQKGFGYDFLEHFKAVKAFDSSACGRAMGIGSTIIINDTETDLGYRPHRAIARAAGFRSVKSVPIMSADYKCLGMISTHFSIPRISWNQDNLSLLMPQLLQVVETYIG